MIDAHKIIYNGLSSEEFDVTLHLTFEGDSGASDSFLNRETVSTVSYDGSRKYIHSAKFTDSAMPKFTLIKKNFSDFTFEENRRILSWLTSSSRPLWLEIYKDDSNVISYRYFCIPTNIELYKLGNSRVIGYQFEIDSSAPYAYSRLFKYPEDPDNLEEIADYLQVSGENTFTITCGTDEYNKLVYPRVTVNFNSEKVYIPIDRDPTINQYKMMSNIIYHNTNTNKYYVNIPNYNYKGEIMGIFGADINSQQADSSTLGNYYYYPANRTLYKGVQIYELATTFTSGTTYYLDNKGLTVADPQPTNKQEIQSGEYYISESFGWEAVTIIGTGIQIENNSVIDNAGGITKTTIVGCRPGEQVVFDGTNRVISSSLDPMRIIGDDFNWEWIPLTEGENRFTVTGNCQIKFEWIEPRKVGNL
jgi:hypothetical protein